MKNTAIVTAVHRDRYELSIGSETTYGRLKTAAFHKRWRQDHRHAGYAKADHGRGRGRYRTHV